MSLKSLAARRPQARHLTAHYVTHFEFRRPFAVPANTLDVRQSSFNGTHHSEHREFTNP
jgi:hypothetical protein